MSSFITLSSHDEKILSTDFDSVDIGENDPFSEARQTAFDDGRTRAGTVSFRGNEAIDHFPHWELLIVIDGALTFEFGAARVNVSVGGALTINRGSRFQITAEAGTKCVFLSVTENTDSNPEPAILVFFDPEAELFSSPSLGADILISDAPVCRNHRMQVRDDIRVRAGVWDSTPYERVFIEQKEHELMHITRGEVTFSDSEGREDVYSAGETFLVPKGVNGKWTSTVDVAKVYAVVS